MLVTFAIVLLAGAAAYIFLFADKEKGWKKPPELLAEYMGYVNQPVSYLQPYFLIKIK